MRVGWAAIVGAVLMTAGAPVVAAVVASVVVLVGMTVADVRLGRRAQVGIPTRNRVETGTHL